MPMLIAQDGRRYYAPDDANPVSEVTVYAPQRYGLDEFGRDARGFMAHVNRGTVIGDELGAGLAAGVDAFTDVFGKGRSPLAALRGVGGNFKRRMAQTRAIEDDFEQRHRNLAKGAQVLGGGATMLVPGGALVKGAAVAGQAVRAGAPLMARLTPYAEGVAESAIASGLSALGDKGTLGERVMAVPGAVLNLANLGGGMGRDVAKGVPSGRARPQARSELDDAAKAELRAAGFDDKVDAYEALDNKIAAGLDDASTSWGSPNVAKRNGVKKWRRETPNLEPRVQAQADLVGQGDGLQNGLQYVGRFAPHRELKGPENIATVWAPLGDAAADMITGAAPTQYSAMPAVRLGIGAPAQWAAEKLTDRRLADLKAELISTPASRAELADAQRTFDWLEAHDPAMERMRADLANRIARANGAIVGVD